MEPKLTIELVPETCHYINVRSNVSKQTWDTIRRTAYRKSSHHCSVCGRTGMEQGYAYPVEAHEVFEYDEKTHVQKLVDVVALCPYCHMVKHFARSSEVGKDKLVQLWLTVVNNFTNEEAVDYIVKCWRAHKRRNLHKWKLDLSYLTDHFGTMTDQNGKEILINGNK